MSSYRSIEVPDSSGKYQYINEVFKADFIQENKLIGEKHIQIIFKKCIFRKKAVFYDVDGEGLSIRFYECKFEDGILIKNNNLDFLSFDLCSSRFPINLNENNVKSELQITNVNGSILVNGNYQNIFISSSNLKKLTLKDINSKSSHYHSNIILLENKIQKVDFDVESLKSTIKIESGDFNNFRFKGVFFEPILFEGDVNIDSLYFESSTLKERFDIFSGKYREIGFFRSSFEGLVWIFESLFPDIKRGLEIERINFHSSNFEKNVSLSPSELGVLDLSNNNFKKLFSFKSNYKQINYSDTVNIFFDGVNQGNVMIEDSYVDVSLAGFNLGNIYFRDLKAFSIYIKDFQNNGNVSFANIYEALFFTIQDSIAGKLEFLSVNFKIFKEIVICDSNIEKVSFSSYPFNIRSFSSNPKVGYGIKDKSLSKSNLKNVYNQLKKVAKNKGNVDVANRYQSLEYRYLFFEKRGSDKVLLFFNFISNNHGRSWFQGVVFTLSIGLLCFYQYYNFFENEFTFKELLKEYVVFMSSFPKLELEEYSKNPKTWDVSLIIWLSRIFISYGIYQTVAAFRKYGKA